MPDEKDNLSQPSQEQSHDGNGEDSRITNKQLNYIVNLGCNVGWNSKDLDEKSVKVFGGEDGIPDGERRLFVH